MRRVCLGGVALLAATSIGLAVPAVAKTPSYKSSVVAEVAGAPGVAGVQGNVSSKFADCERRTIEATVTFTDGSVRELDEGKSYNEGRFSMVIQGVTDKNTIQSAFVEVLPKAKRGKKPYKCKPTSTTAYPTQD